MKLSEKTAWMTQRECMDLPEYNTSYPTALPIGKRWKRRHASGWSMAEVIDHDGGDAIIKWRKLVVMPKEHEDKVTT